MYIGKFFILCFIFGLERISFLSRAKINKSFYFGAEIYGWGKGKSYSSYQA